MYVKPTVLTTVERVLGGEETPQSIKSLHLDDKTERAAPLAREMAGPQVVNGHRGT